MVAKMVKFDRLVGYCNNARQHKRTMQWTTGEGCSWCTAFYWHLKFCAFVGIGGLSRTLVANRYEISMNRRGTGILHNKYYIQISGQFAGFYKKYARRKFYELLNFCSSTNSTEYFCCFVLPESHFYFESQWILEQASFKFKRTVKITIQRISSNFLPDAKQYRLQVIITFVMQTHSRHS